MFQNLARKINVETLRKLKHQSKPRYSEQDDIQQEQSEKSDQSLQLEFEQRLQKFKRIQELEEQQDRDFLKKSNTEPPNLLRKLGNQIELLKEQLQIQRKEHQRQQCYQNQLSKRRQEWLHAENNKLSCQLKRHQGESQQIKELRKNIAKCEQIKERLQQRIQRIEQQNRCLKANVEKLEKQNSNLKKKQQIEQFKQQKSQTENLQAKLKLAEQNLYYEKQSNQQKRKKLEKIRHQLQNEKQKHEHKQRQLQQIIAKKQSSSQQRQIALKQQISELRKRNQSLESTFIDKMGEITKLQAHLLSYSTQSHQSMSAEAAIRHSTHYAQQALNEVSPIKPNVQAEHTLSQKKAINFYSAQVNLHSENNPETLNKNFKIEGKCKCCYQRIQLYKRKLDQANQTILDLLQQKLKGINQSGNKSEIEAGRKTRIMSWKCS